MTEGYRCATCGEWHEGIPYGFSIESPVYWGEIPANERGGRDLLEEDFCEIEGKDFFIRGVIELPILEPEVFFGWTVWSSLSAKNYRRARTIWNDPSRQEEPPYFGWLSSRIRIYPETINLKTNVQLRKAGILPRITLEPTEHPLSIEQRQGISQQRWEQIVALVRHSQE